MNRPTSVTVFGVLNLMFAAMGLFGLVDLLLVGAMLLGLVAAALNR